MIVVTLDQYSSTRIASCGTFLNYAKKYCWNLILGHLIKLILEKLDFFKKKSNLKRLDYSTICCI